MQMRLDNTGRIEVERFSSVANTAMPRVYRDQAGRNAADLYRVICIRVQSVSDSEMNRFASILAIFPMCAPY